MALKTVAVVGASLAGLRAVETLRRDGFDGRIVLDRRRADAALRPAAALEGAARGRGRARRHRAAARGPTTTSISSCGSARAPVSLDLAGHARRPRRRRAGRVRRARDRHRRDAAHAAGHARSRRVCSCCARSTTRSRSARRSTPNPRVVVVGAGFIGSEVAATCRLRGLDVTVLEALPAPLVRGLGPVLGMVCGELHRDHGVDLRLGVGVAGFEGTDARRAGPARRRHRGRRRRRRRGRRRRAGHRLARRIRAHSSTTASCATPRCSRRPAWSRAGDITRWPNPLFDGELMRLEHWTNATEQGVAAARRLLYGDGAAPEPFAPVPFVWSDQYDRKIQTVGHFRGDDDMEVVHGSLDERRFVAVFGRAGRLVGALGLLDAREGDAVPPDDRRAGVVRRRARTRTRRRRDVAPRHQRLPAEDRRHPVVPVRALATVAARARPPCSPRTTPTTRRGTRCRRFRVVRAHESQFFPTSSLARRIDALAREVGADGDLRRPVAAARSARTAPARGAVRRRRARRRGDRARPSARLTRARRARVAPRRGRRRRERVLRARSGPCRAAAAPRRRRPARRRRRSLPPDRRRRAPRGAEGVRARRRAAPRRRDEPAGAAQGLRRAHRRRRRAARRAARRSRAAGATAVGLEARAAKRGLGRRARFLGRVPDAALAPLLACADLFAMPCRDRWLGLEAEGFGIVFLEAAAAGVPVVAGRSGGSHEAVVDGATGFVVDGRSAA